MFKKVAVLLLALMLIGGVAFASPVNKTIISETQLDDDPTSVTSSTVNIQDYKKVGFWVEYDETQVGASVSAAVTLDVSYDGTNWLDVYFYDIAGTTTAQTSETISSDGWYYCALPDAYLSAGTIPYVRMVITATNTDADDLAVVTAYLTGIK